MAHGIEDFKNGGQKGAVADALRVDDSKSISLMTV